MKICTLLKGPTSCHTQERIGGTRRINRDPWSLKHLFPFSQACFYKFINMAWGSSAPWGKRGERLIRLRFLGINIKPPLDSVSDWNAKWTLPLAKHFLWGVGEAGDREACVLNIDKENDASLRIRKYHLMLSISVCSCCFSGVMSQYDRLVRWLSE